MGILSSLVSGYNQANLQQRGFDEQERIRQMKLAQEQALMERLRGANDRYMPGVLENNPAIDPEGLTTRQLSNQRGMRDNQIRRALRTNFETRELAPAWGQKDMFKPQLAAPTVYEGQNSRYVYNPNEDTANQLPGGVPLKKSGQTINITNTPAARANKQQEKVDTYFGDQYTGNLERLNVLEGQLNSVRSIASDLDGLYTGTGGELLTEAMKLANLGQVLSPEQEQLLGRRENARLKIKDMIVRFKMPEFKGAMSDRDVAFMEETINNETTTSQGIKMGVLAAEQERDYFKDLVKAQKDYKKSNNGILDDQFIAPKRTRLSFEVSKDGKKYYAIRHNPDGTTDYIEM